MFQEMDYPCVHACCAIVKLREQGGKHKSLRKYFASYYQAKALRATYAGILRLPGTDELEQVATGEEIVPAWGVNNEPGRPQALRFQRGKGKKHTRRNAEGIRRTKAVKGASRCGACGQLGHNARNKQKCPGPRAPPRRPVIGEVHMVPMPLNMPAPAPLPDINMAAAGEIGDNFNFVLA